jgi:hypothetical protein
MEQQPDAVCLKNTGFCLSPGLMVHWSAPFG